MTTLMDVEIDGKIEQRPVDHVVVHKGRSVGISELQFRGMKRVPVLHEGEQIVWRVGSTVPLIIPEAR